ncbi:hypothetical protein GCM10011328_18640 [Hafnia psychrotolerans]|jgi:hypothetical protein|uniref:Addiction module toxin RelE n=1 Tax=Hafnia psychrotolerans TaxID=1477018 RepID=A0ABQ1GHJ6_9GAMM|nr:hypothetical protein GCM10011328_18640 [Hafnia psychrotolerans]
MAALRRVVWWLNTPSKPVLSILRSYNAKSRIARLMYWVAELEIGTYLIVYNILEYDYVSKR